MRTKIAFLTAAATVAGLLSASAQVYSVNIVGYANTTLQGNGRYTLVANPFNDGNGNSVSNILSTSLPKQSQILTWGGVSFTTTTKGGTLPNWPANVTNLPPGIGFFVRNGSVGSLAPDITNTWVGSLVQNSGTIRTSTIPLNFQMFGSPVPYAGALAIAGTNIGDTNINLSGMLTKTAQILTWNQAGQSYNTTTKGGTAVIWNNTANVSVGEGFFVNNKAGPATNWYQVVP